MDTAATSATIAACLEWHGLGVKPGNIANAVEAQGLPLPPGVEHWDAEAVKGVLKAAGVDIAEDRPKAGALEVEEPEGWIGHNGLRPERPRA